MAIEGCESIDVQGDKFKVQRSMLLCFLNCKDIHLNDITLLSLAVWTALL